mmetsp:Transcript_49733/g.97522  ORF Transcript_49733/g.97522 Transcript_49733/m.97522 type:complete len:221 (-) Transcript_49733:178-840(-)
MLFCCCQLLLTLAVNNRELGLQISCLLMRCFNCCVLACAFTFQRAHFIAEVIDLGVQLVRFLLGSLCQFLVVLQLYLCSLFLHLGFVSSSCNQSQLSFHLLQLLNNFVLTFQRDGDGSSVRLHFVVQLLFDGNTPLYKRGLALFESAEGPSQLFDYSLLLLIPGRIVKLFGSHPELHGLVHAGLHRFVELFCTFFSHQRSNLLGVLGLVITGEKWFCWRG